MRTDAAMPERVASTVASVNPAPASSRQAQNPTDVGQYNAPNQFFLSSLYSSRLPRPGRRVVPAEGYGPYHLYAGPTARSSQGGRHRKAPLPKGRTRLQPQHSVLPEAVLPGSQRHLPGGQAGRCPESRPANHTNGRGHSAYRKRQQPFVFLRFVRIILSVAAGGQHPDPPKKQSDN